MLGNPQWGHRFDRVRRAWFDGSTKLIHSSDGAHELYDLDQDPQEESSLFTTREPLARRLIAAVETAVRDRAVPSDRRPVQLTAEEAERLKTLGYIIE